MQVNRLSSLTKTNSIDLPQNGPAACGQYASAVQGQLVNQLSLQITKGSLTLTFKKFAYGTTDAHFYDMVGVNKPDAQAPGKLSPDGRLARARQTDAGDSGWVVVHVLILGPVILPFIRLKRSGTGSCQYLGNSPESDKL